MLRKRITLVVCAMALGLSFTCTQAFAQAVADPDQFKVNWFVNANTAAPPGNVVVTNSGQQNAFNLCALIYVFRPDQQLDECCGCVITHNEYRTFDVNDHLTFNPLTGTKTTKGTIKIVSSLLAGGFEPFADFQCNNIAQGLGGPPPPGSTSSGLKAWITHPNTNGTTFQYTESEFSEATLSAQEQNFVLREQCFFAQILGSGKGKCACPPPDPA